MEDIYQKKFYWERDDAYSNYEETTSRLMTFGPDSYEYQYLTDSDDTSNAYYMDSSEERVQLEKIVPGNKSVVVPKKTNDITKIKGWRKKKFLENTVEAPVEIKEEPNLEITDRVEVQHQLTEELEGAFISDNLDAFIDNEAELDINYEVPHLSAEESIKLTSEEVVQTSKLKLKENTEKEVNRSETPPPINIQELTDKYKRRMKTVVRTTFRPKESKQMVKYDNKKVEEPKKKKKVESAKNVRKRLKKIKSGPRFAEDKPRRFPSVKNCSHKTLGLLVYPGPFAPLKKPVQQHLDNLRADKTKVDKYWANFASSVVYDYNVPQRPRPRMILPTNIPVQRKNLGYTKKDEIGKKRKNGVKMLKRFQNSEYYKRFELDDGADRRIKKVVKDVVNDIIVSIENSLDMDNQYGFDSPTKPTCSMDDDVKPDCWNPSCRLGCVCCDQNDVVRASHCGQAECIFGCVCTDANKKSDSNFNETNMCKTDDVYENKLDKMLSKIYGNSDLRYSKRLIRIPKKFSETIFKLNKDNIGINKDKNLIKKDKNRINKVKNGINKVKNEINKDKNEIYKDKYEINKDKNRINKDKNEINIDKNEIYKDKNEINKDKNEIYTGKNEVNKGKNVINKGLKPKKIQKNYIIKQCSVLITRLNMKSATLKSVWCCLHNRFNCEICKKQRHKNVALKTTNGLAKKCKKVYVKNNRLGQSPKNVSESKMAIRSAIIRLLQEQNWKNKLFDKVENLIDMELNNIGLFTMDVVCLPYVDNTISLWSYRISEDLPAKLFLTFDNLPPLSSCVRLNDLTLTFPEILLRMFKLDFFKNELLMVIERVNSYWIIHGIVSSEFISNLMVKKREYRVVETDNKEKFDNSTTQDEVVILDEDVQEIHEETVKSQEECEDATPLNDDVCILSAQKKPKSQISYFDVRVRNETLALNSPKLPEGVCCAYKWFLLSTKQEFDSIYNTSTKVSVSSIAAMRKPFFSNDMQCIVQNCYYPFAMIGPYEYANDVNIRITVNNAIVDFAYNATTVPEDCENVLSTLVRKYVFEDGVQMRKTTKLWLVKYVYSDGSVRNCLEIWKKSLKPDAELINIADDEIDDNELVNDLDQSVEEPWVPQIDEVTTLVESPEEETNKAVKPTETYKISRSVMNPTSITVMPGQTIEALVNPSTVFTVTSGHSITVADGRNDKKEENERKILTAQETPRLERERKALAKAIESRADQLVSTRTIFLVPNIPMGYFKATVGQNNRFSSGIFTGESEDMAKKINSLLRDKLTFFPEDLVITWSIVLEEESLQNSKKFDMRYLSGDYVLTSQGAFHVSDCGLLALDLLRPYPHDPSFKNYAGSTKTSRDLPSKLINEINLVQTENEIFRFVKFFYCLYLQRLIAKYNDDEEVWSNPGWLEAVTAYQVKCKSTESSKKMLIFCRHYCYKMIGFVQECNLEKGTGPVIDALRLFKQLLDVSPDEQLEKVESLLDEFENISIRDVPNNNVVKPKPYYHFGHLKSVNINYEDHDYCATYNLPSRKFVPITTQTLGDKIVVSFYDKISKKVEAAGGSVEVVEQHPPVTEPIIILSETPKIRVKTDLFPNQTGVQDIKSDIVINMGNRMKQKQNIDPSSVLKENNVIILPADGTQANMTYVEDVSIVPAMKRKVSDRDDCVNNARETVIVADSNVSTSNNDSTEIVVNSTNVPIVFTKNTKSNLRSAVLNNNLLLSQNIVPNSEQTFVTAQQTIVPNSEQTNVKLIFSNQEPSLIASLTPRLKRTVAAINSKYKAPNVEIIPGRSHYKKPDGPSDRSHIIKVFTQIPERLNSKPNYYITKSRNALMRKRLNDDVEIILK